MLRALTDAEIVRLAGLPGVRRIAVENFLSGVELCKTRGGALLNLADDARSYKWTPATVAAIKAGIALAAK